MNNPYKMTMFDWLASIGEIENYQKGQNDSCKMLEKLEKKKQRILDILSRIDKVNKRSLKLWKKYSIIRDAINEIEYRRKMFDIEVMKNFAKAMD